MVIKNGIVHCHLLAYDQRLEELIGDSAPIYLQFAFKLSALIGVREITESSDSDEVSKENCTLLFSDQSVSVNVPYTEMLQLWSDKINYL